MAHTGSRSFRLPFAISGLLHLGLLALVFWQAFMAANSPQQPTRAKLELRLVEVTTRAPAPQAEPVLPAEVIAPLPTPSERPTRVSGEEQAEPAAAEVAAQQVLPAKSAEPPRPEPPIIPRLHQPAQAGQQIVYLLDRSASMGLGRRLDQARQAIVASLAQGDARVQFQVLLYNRRVTPLRSPSSSGNWWHAGSEELRTLEAELAWVRAEGSTAHAVALRRGLAARPDALFLISDGEGLTLAEVDQLTRVNAGRSVIHVVRPGRAGSSPNDRPALGRLAQQNQGTVRNLSETR